MLVHAPMPGCVHGRLNWQLHFGEPPKWSKEVKFILVDVEPSQVDASKAALVLRGDAAAVAEQLSSALTGLDPSRLAQWRGQLHEKVGTCILQPVDALLVADRLTQRQHGSTRESESWVALLGMRGHRCSTATRAQLLSVAPSEIQTRCMHAGPGSQAQAGGAPGEGGVPAGLQHRAARDPRRAAGHRAGACGGLRGRQHHGQRQVTAACLTAWAAPMAWPATGLKRCFSVTHQTMRLASACGPQTPKTCLKDALMALQVASSSDGSVRWSIAQRRGACTGC